MILVLEKKRPQRLKPAILRGRIQDIGKFKIYTKQKDLNADSKRYWFGKLTSVHNDQYFNSSALDVNLGGRLYTNLEFYEELEVYNPYENEL